MQRIISKTGIAGIVITFLAIIFSLTSCLTTQEVSRDSTKKSGNNAFKSALENLKPKEQDLTEKEKEDIALWKSTDQKIFVQNHLVPTQENPVRPYNPWVASYEGFRMASLLGLDADFSKDEMYRFIRALFDDMPNDVETGELVKSIVIADWYDDSSPLVVNVTRAFVGNQVPAVAYMFNTWDNLRSYGLPLIKKAGIAYEYPRLKMPNGEFRREFMDTYAMSWLDNGFVTASGSVGKEPADFSTANDDHKKLNLTDDWLRDGNMENDADVLSVLRDVIKRDQVKPIDKVFARMQLFMYHLFHGEVDAAQLVIDELNKSGLLESPEVADTEVGIMAKRDLQRILDVAVRLSES